MLAQLKIALLQRGVNQGELARAIGRTPAHVSRLIRGRVRLRARDRRRIASFLGIAESKLFPRKKQNKKSAESSGETPRR
jgi:transcriptional regulator with XRE-family HTH domain